MKLVKIVKVKNTLGLHIRPATAIVKLLKPFQSLVFFTYKEEMINARSIMSILKLMVKKNTQITITAEGEDAQDTMKALQKAFDKCFKE